MGKAWLLGVSQGHGGAGVLELAGQHSPVELVKLHQVDQVGEFCGAVVQAKEHLTVILALLKTKQKNKHTDDCERTALDSQ